MKLATLHDWKVSPAEGRAIQDRLAGQVILCPRTRPFRWVAGADLCFSRGHQRFFASVLVFRLPDLELVETASVRMRPTFPYVPGLLSFREGPLLIEAFGKLRREPEAVIFDGQGIAHPRRFGLASHLGLWLDLPSVGCAKSRLVGEHAEPAPRRGSSSPLMDRGEQVGVVLRTRDRTRPVFVSPGHRIDFPGAVELVLSCCRGYRLPEPTRLADIEVARVKKEYEASRTPTPAAP